MYIPHPTLSRKSRTALLQSVVKIENGSEIIWLHNFFLGLPRIGVPSEIELTAIYSDFISTFRSEQTHYEPRGEVRFYLKQNTIDNPTLNYTNKNYIGGKVTVFSFENNEYLFKYIWYVKDAKLEESVFTLLLDD